MPGIEPRDRPLLPQKKEHLHLLHLPTEIQIQILSHLDACDQVYALQTCTLWHTLLLSKKLLLKSRYSLHVYENTRDGLGVHKLLKPRDGIKLQATVLDGVIQRFFLVDATDTHDTTEGPDITRSPLLDEVVCSPYPAVIAFTPRSRYASQWAQGMVQHAQCRRENPHSGVAVHYREPDETKVRTRIRWNFFKFNGWRTVTVRQLVEAGVRFLERQPPLGGDRADEFTGTVVRGVEWRLQVGVEALDEAERVVEGLFRFSVLRLMQRDIEDTWWRDV
ncbi:hypothetical protein Dda_7375 [Drechslerella dactyloides]|uniref:F-box domain-containing protein n=1 Tax=Drechslerella dactyloides TaxID=74499 RepID=A0AAD6NGN2_DREDA|nr:hypothetical protein Dda_7375 [Drechslerella dactyloides]